MNSGDEFSVVVVLPNLDAMREVRGARLYMLLYCAREERRVQQCQCFESRSDK
jgi:hypothetical protein